MSNEKYYRYFRLSGQEVKDLDAKYEPLHQQRLEAIKRMQEASGAVGFTLTSKTFGGKAGLIKSLAFPADHDFGVPVTIKYRNRIDSKPVVIVRGKRNTKEGRAFNSKLDAWVAVANEEIGEAIPYTSWIIEHYGIHCSEIHGSSLISTYGGKCSDKDVLLFAIPVVLRGNAPEIPASFEEITYGQFYDLSNAGGDE